LNKANNGGRLEFTLNKDFIQSILHTEKRRQIM
jgi:hypothetical protein